MSPTNHTSPDPDAKQPPSKPAANLFVLNSALRLLLFATTMAALLVTVTSNQTKVIFAINFEAKFTHSPAIIYFVVAMSVACLYSILSLIPSVRAISNPHPSPKLLFTLALVDMFMTGVVASAAGAVASVAYIGLRGNKHVGWSKVCNIFERFCWHIGSSVVMALGATVVLVLLAAASTFSLYRRCH